MCCIEFEAASMTLRFFSFDFLMLVSENFYTLNTTGLTLETSHHFLILRSLATIDSHSGTELDSPLQVSQVKYSKIIIQLKLSRSFSILPRNLYFFNLARLLFCLLVWSLQEPPDWTRDLLSV